MGNVSRFTVVPPLRCDFRASPSDPLPCGARAIGIRFATGQLPVAFRCAQHLGREDLPIPASYLCRRVTLHADVLFAGTSLGLTAAKTEAVARLEQAVERVGGLLNLHGADSDVGLYSPPVPPGRERVIGRGGG
jgi:hypothetical protein